MGILREGCLIILDIDQSKYLQNNPLSANQIAGRRKGKGGSRKNLIRCDVCGIHLCLTCFKLFHMCVNLGEKKEEINEFLEGTIGWKALNQALRLTIH